MRPSPSTQPRAATTARIVGITIAALALPALVLLVITSFVRQDEALLNAAVALAGTAAITAVVTAFIVYLVGYLGEEGTATTIPWLFVLVIPAFVVWEVARGFSRWWLRSPALQDVSAVEPDRWELVLIAVVVAAFFLAVPISSRGNQPLALRHRRGAWTERTLLGMFVVGALATFVARATQIPRFATSSILDGPQAVLALLAREASRYPNHFLTQYRYGNALARTRDCAFAVAPLERARTLAPRDAGAVSDLAWALSCSQQFGEALEAYRDAAHLEPDSLRVRLGYAWMLERTHDRTEAAEEYRRILFNWPGEPIATARQALLRYDRGNRDQAMAEMRNVLARADTNYWVRLSAAQMFASAAMLGDALAQYRWLTMRNSTDMWTWTQYASTAYLANELEEARRAFSHIEAVHPGLIDQMPALRAMRDAANRGIAPSGLPPIQPYSLHSDSLGIIRVQTAR